jgi:hypothetical protein
MEDENYPGNYELKIRLADSAWLNESYRKRVESGELEEIILNSEGINKLWKGVEGVYQNVAVMKNFMYAFSLMKKINKLPYVQGINFVKEGLRSRDGYIPIKD